MSAPPPRLRGRAATRTLLFGAALAAVSCGDASTGAPAIHRGNAAEVAVAATDAATSAYFAAWSAMLIGGGVAVADPGAAGLAMILVVHVEPTGGERLGFDDPSCLETGGPGDEDSVVLSHCGIDDCEVDGVALGRPHATLSWGQWGYDYDDASATCGDGETALDLHGLSVTCEGDLGWTWTCRVEPGHDASAAVEVWTSAAIRIPLDPTLEDPPPPRLLAHLSGTTPRGAPGPIDFASGYYGLGFDGCPRMVPASGMLELEGRDGSAATLYYRGCERFDVCIERDNGEALDCEGFDWSDELGAG